MFQKFDIILTIISAAQTKVPGIFSRKFPRKVLHLSPVQYLCLYVLTKISAQCTVHNAHATCNRMIGMNVYRRADEIVSAVVTTPWSIWRSERGQLILMARVLQLVGDRHTVNRHNGGDPGHTGELQQWTFVLLFAQISSGTDKITFRWPLGIQPLISRYFRSIVLNTPMQFCPFPLLHMWPAGNFKGQQRPPFVGRVYKRTICSCVTQEGRWGWVDLYVHSLNFGTKWGEVSASLSDRFVRSEISHGKIGIGVPVWMLCRTQQPTAAALDRITTPLLSSP